MSHALTRALAEATDGELARLMGLGCVRALDELAERYLPTLRNHAAGILGDVFAAEDVAMQVLEWVWAHRMDWSPVCVRALLVRKARWLAYSELRKRRASERRDHAYAARPLMNPESPDDSAARAELRRALSLAIARLPARQREAFLLRSLGRRSYQEVGEVMDISPRTAEHYVAMASEKLRASLRMEATDWLPSARQG